MTTLTKEQLNLLTDIILEDDTDTDDATEYCESLLNDIFFFEEEHLDGNHIDADDRKALFAKCMKTFTNDQYNATYTIGFIRGLKEACEIKEPVTLTL